MAKSKFKHEEPIETLPVEDTAPLVYPLLKLYSTYQGEIDGTRFRVFPRYVAGMQTLPDGNLGKVWTEAEVYQNDVKQTGEHFSGLSDLQKSELQRVGMIQ